MASCPGCNKGCIWCGREPNTEYMKNLNSAYCQLRFANEDLYSLSKPNEVKDELEKYIKDARCKEDIEELEELKRRLSRATWVLENLTLENAKKAVSDAEKEVYAIERGNYRY